MKKLTRRQSGWLACLLLFSGVFVSMLSMFEGNLWFLILSALLLIAGLFFLKQYLSGQSLS